jgi:hypothetical protein
MMIKRLPVLVGVSMLLLVFAREARKPMNDYSPTVSSKQRMAAEVTDSDILKEEVDSHYRADSGKKHGHHQREPDPEPLHDTEPWDESDPNARHDVDPWPHQKPPDPWDPWYQEPDSWHDPDSWEEPCIPVHPETSEYGVNKRPHHPRNSQVQVEEDRNDLQFEEHNFVDIESHKDNEKAHKPWWHDPHINEPKKKSKGMKGKGSKGTKGTKGSKSKSWWHYKPMPKHPKHNKPKPCPTKKEPTKAPTEEPTQAPVETAASEDFPSPYYKRPSGTEARTDEKAISLPFSIQFDVQELRFPTESDIDGITNTTMDLLQDFFFATFATDKEIMINFLSVDSPAKSKIENDVVYVPFTAIAYFSMDSVLIPSEQSLNFLLLHAFQGESLDTYHEELTELPETNVFFSANVQSVLIVNEHDDSPPNDDEENDATTSETLDEENTHDPSNHEEDPPPKNVSTTLNDPKDPDATSTSMAPPIMVITVVSITVVTMGAFFVHLSRQQSIQKESTSHGFPPSKNNGGHSVSDATIILQDEDSLVECEIGDNDFCDASSGSSGRSPRRSRAENFLRLLEEDHDKNSSAPRPLLIANACRGGNTWTHNE